MTPYDAARAAFDAYAHLNTPDEPTDELSAIQVRLCRWGSTKIPGSLGWLYTTTLGMGEEVGELALSVLKLAAAVGRAQHAALKHSQGIRGYDDEEKVRREVADAIADVCVFAMQLCTRCRLDFGTLFRATAAKVMGRDWVADPLSAHVAGNREMGL